MFNILENENDKMNRNEGSIIYYQYILYVN
jgi:hypothetical protein